MEQGCDQFDSIFFERREAGGQRSGGAGGIGVDMVPKGSGLVELGVGPASGFSEEGGEEVL